ncbi:MAG: hypothetical protein ACE5HT_11545 [Gemmatimonadales bacterium]
MTDNNAHTRSNVLDVVRAVTEVAPRHPEITVWWYVPRELGNPKIELLVEVATGRQPDFTAIAEDVESHLYNAEVTVARHSGEREIRKLFKVASREAQAPS